MIQNYWTIEQEIDETFSQEREDKWKARLAELATNPRLPSRIKIR